MSRSGVCEALQRSAGCRGTRRGWGVNVQQCRCNAPDNRESAPWAGAVAALDGGVLEQDDGAIGCFGIWLGCGPGESMALARALVFEADALLSIWIAGSGM